MSLDPRLTPARPDLAAAHLRGSVEAERFVEGQACRIVAPTAAMRRMPDRTAPYDTELLYGEPVTVYETEGDWAWGQSGLDGYVGYLPAALIAPTGAWQASHRVRTLGSSIYAAPVLKSPPIGALPFGARVSVADRRDGFARIVDLGWVPLPQLATLEQAETDWVATAERLTGLPYIWGGRSSDGLDCSALIQLSRQASGHDCPRDSDMQAAGLGQTLGDDAALTRGDLIFWRGHVGVMRDAAMLLHANAHHMAVASEPLDQAIARIAGAGDGPVTRRARLDVAPFPE